LDVSLCGAFVVNSGKTIVAEVLALADSVGPTLCAADEARAWAHFATTACYEWMFWDAAWRRELWPV
jgi:thiaminase/transcriptional activator TenA